MYFKKLELIGFKSFAEKTTLEFEAGVSAVVGPNGCGKSNISDAIRWVLGEQSAKSMRGTSMEDVIFNGTAQKEAVNVAEVSIVLSNESRKLPIEYDEVVLTRRVYRSGESEYMINRNIVRLRDVQSLMMGTGMGVNNYSIIEQGKIDLLISAKPENRRELFDEAAGITRFKSQKKEALRKMEQVEGNLQRIADIIAEVKRQISSIERQARKAEKYKEDFSVMKRFDIRQAFIQRDEINASVHDIETQMSGVSAKKESSDYALQDVNKLLKEAREELAEIDKSFSDVRMKQAVLDKDIHSIEEKMSVHSERIGEYETKSASLAEEVSKLILRVQELRIEERGLQESLGAIERENTEGHVHLVYCEKSYADIESEIKSALKEIDNLKIEMVDNAAKHSQNQNELTKLESSVHNFTARNHRLEIEKNKVTRERDAANVRYDEVTIIVDELRGQIRNRIHDREELESSLEDAKTSLKQVQLRLNNLTSEISSHQSKLDVLQDISSRHEGFSQGVRHLLSEKHDGVLGTLADLVEVDRGYELAMESALELYAQSLICEDESVIMSLSRLLKASNKGMATFVNMRTYERFHAEPTMVHDSDAQPLLRYGRPHSRLERFFGILVRDIYVVATLEKACELIKEHPKVIFVTQSGDLVQEGRIKTGSINPSEETLLFGREARIRELKSKLITMQCDLDQIKTREDELKQKEHQYHERLKEFNVQIPKAQMQLADVSSQAEHLGKEKDKLQEELTVIELEAQETQDEIDAFRERESQLKVQVENLDARRRSCDEIIKSNQERVIQKRQQKENSLIEITRLRSLQDTLQDRRDRAQKDHERMHEILGHEESTAAARQEEIASLGQRVAHLKEGIEGLESNRTRYANDRAELLDKNKFIVEKRERWSANVSRLENEKHSAEELVIQLQDTFHKLQVAIREKAHEVDRVLDRIQSNYQVDMQEVSEMPHDEGAPTRDEIEKIRERLAKVGPVNLIAIEEHEDLKKRFEFLIKEQEDLLKAKDDIHKAILKINRTTREKFIDSFTKIQGYFVEYYKQLFNGGRAELVLLNENDVLDSGIEIIARPPGKKLQSITLLSGGEKALTAIALLFAVLKVKPSPFCILDEIDAPLDEINVQRLSSVLKEFVKGSQFIIITHNKRTMALADVMYGITMQQTGQSRVVSVKFGTDESAVPVNSKRRVMV